jgi:hypothetical protein
MAPTLRLTSAVVLGLSLLLPGGASAQERQQPFKVLISDGFMIVSSFIVPAEVHRTPNPAVVVTLQRATSVAVCTFGMADWENMTDGMADTASYCDVRTY